LFPSFFLVSFLLFVCLFVCSFVFLAGNSSSFEYAIATKGPMVLEGQYLWKLKQRIDLQFMALYSNLSKEMMNVVQAPSTAPQSSGVSHEQIALITHNPQQQLHPRPEDFVPNGIALTPDMNDLLLNATMRCGGCGSKVGSQVLTRALSRVRAFTNLITPSSGNAYALILMFPYSM
jgi:hypothetical protein